MSAASILDRKLFAADTVIFAEGTRGDRAYIVEKGVVEITKHGTGGDRTLGFIRPGGIFGEMALIDDEPRMATATAAEPTVCIVVPECVVRQSLRKASPFLRALVAMLVQDLRSVAEELTTREPLL